MDWKAKTGIAAGILLLVAIMVFIIKIQYDTIERLKFIETSVVESKDIGNGIVRAQSGYATKKDLERIIKEYDLNLGEIKKDLRKLGADVKGVQVVRVATPGYSGTYIPTSETGETNPNPPKPGQTLTDPNGYFERTQWLTLTEPFEDDKEVPLGRAGFSAWQDKPWSLDIHPRTYSSTTVLGQNEDGRHYAYSKFQIEVEGETYTVPISESKIVEEYPKAKFHFNPRVYLGIDGGLIANPPAHAEVMPNLGLSIFSYGRTKVSPDFSFVTIGVGYATQTQAPVLMLAPVNYNVGKPIPLIDNFHIGPSVSIDVDGNVGIYVGGRVAL